MNDLQQRIQKLPPEKRALFERLLRQREDSGADPRPSYAAPRTPAERILVAAWEEVLAIGRIGVNDNVLHLGADSIHCIQFVAKVRHAGIEISTAEVFARPVISDLATVARPLPAISEEQGPVTGSLPLTPIQQWFFELKLANRSHWNQAVLLTAPPLKAEALRSVLDALVAHHDALRLRFRQSPAGDWEQWIAEVEPAALDVFSCENARGVEPICAGLQTRVNIEHGPVFRAGLIHIEGGTAARLFLCAHHLAADAVSFRILIEDLQRGLDQLESGRELQFPLKTTSIQRWSEQLRKEAVDEKLLEEAEWWIAQPKPEPVPLDFPDGRNTESSSSTVTMVFDGAETDALLRLPVARGLQMQHVLLAALALAYRDWSGREAIFLDLEGHGRDAVSDAATVSRTVGWFTSIYPACLSAGPTRDCGLAAIEIRKQLGVLPGHGAHYAMLRYCGPRAVRERMSHAARPLIMFNYLGQLGQVESGSVFRVAEENHGRLYDPDGTRPHVLQVFGGVLSGRLRLHCTYSSNLHRRETIEAWMSQIRDSLRAFAGTAGSTPSPTVDDDVPAEDVRRIVAQARS